MKSILNSLKIAFTFLILVGCSNSDDSDSNVYGTIQLSGADTAVVGSSLTVGNIDSDALDTTGTSSSVVLLDENTTFVNGEIESSDYSNAFIIVAAEFNAVDEADVEKSISMTIVKNGVQMSYVCTSPATTSGGNIDCGTGFSVDKVEQEIIFSNTTVINVENENVLTMNGVIQYN
ncbi:hypothetical protein [Winogradskyella endarachnes]|uniref:Uncharacterized protein n=1 Tax=Winogradskyella endarachnes TaxID=2681965 RepID=A0A6L6U9V7_9FLAO|nr:hypothetical protein [Winogradskyella endarachnes]MUU78296.1 hypothetical protein [Winogradskyella endarachnes]